MVEIKRKVMRVLPAELRPFKGVLAKAGVKDTVTLKRVIKPDRVKRFVKKLSEDFPDELDTFALRFELEQKLGDWVEGILAQ